RVWTDNFHTAYVLDSFHAYERCLGDANFRRVVDAGWEYYRDNFFLEGKIPKYYAAKMYPVDATACAQSLSTLIRFGALETAFNVAAWAIENMQCPDGHFAYQV